jgi:AbiV family abortive infection protein
MRARAIGDLSQLADRELFSEVAEGLARILENARRLHNSAKLLAEAEGFHPSRVLHVLSDEEAAKFLILLDAVRCPRQPSDRFSAQLRRFNDHLAKGLYARACGLCPATPAELQKFLDSYREEFYLDGPNSVDWIFRNEIHSHREEVLYVDYVATDEGRVWLDPGRYAALGPFARSEPASLRLGAELHQAGMTTAEGLAVVAEVWRPIVVAPDMPWQRLRELNHETLRRLDSRGLLQPRSSGEYGRIVDEWPFPMYGLDLTLIAVDPESLRKLQARWTPDW